MLNLPIEAYLAVRHETDLDRLLYSTIIRHPNLAGVTPAPVHSLAREFGEVITENWDTEINGVVDGLLEEQQTFYLRKVPATSLRSQNFTLAHLLGHALIPWHAMPVAACVVSAKESDTSLDSDLETEANQFAAKILMPYSQVQKIAQKSTSLSEFFSHMDRFALSPEATVFGLTKLLVPGFVFRLWQGNEPREYTSDRNLFLPPRVFEREKLLHELAIADGEFTVAGQKISWFFITDDQFTWSEPALSDKSSYEILQEALEMLGESDAIRTYRGLVSGILLKPKTHDAQLLYSHVNFKLRFDERVPDTLRNSVLFQQYIKVAIRERLDKLAD